MLDKICNIFSDIASNLKQELEGQPEAWKEAPLRVYFLTSATYAGVAYEAYQDYRIYQNYYDSVGFLFQRYNMAYGIDCAFWGSLSLAACYAGVRKWHLEYNEQKADCARYYRAQSYQETHMNPPPDKIHVVDRQNFMALAHWGGADNVLEDDGAGAKGGMVLAAKAIGGGPISKPKAPEI